MAKYHIGRKGPAICRARPEDPNGRACQFEVHGEKAEIESRWDRMQEEEHGFVVEVRKKSSKGPDKKSLKHTRESLEDRAKYQSEYYTDENRAIAMKLALTNLSPLAYTPVKNEDHDFYSEGFSATHRLRLEDGSAGYFKPFLTNSEDEYDFEEYGETSLGATVNEVNAHRMAKEMGGGYETLVPETVIREYDGKLGSIQREAVALEHHSRSASEESQRKAGVFDFAIGSLDRHDGNCLYTSDGTKYGEQVVLIDNSFSFVRESTSEYALNSSRFASAMADRPLTDDDRVALERGRKALDRWESEGTISTDQAHAARRRFDIMLAKGKVPDIRDHMEEHYSKKE